MSKNELIKLKEKLLNDKKDYKGYSSDGKVNIPPKSLNDILNEVDTKKGIQLFEKIAEKYITLLVNNNIEFDGIEITLYPALFSTQNNGETSPILENTIIPNIYPLDINISPYFYKENEKIEIFVDNPEAFEMFDKVFFQPVKYDEFIYALKDLGYDFPEKYFYDFINYFTNENYILKKNSVYIDFNKTKTHTK